LLHPVVLTHNTRRIKMLMRRHAAVKARKMKRTKEKENTKPREFSIHFHQDEFISIIIHVSEECVNLN
jgi:hypothetical protein